MIIELSEEEAQVVIASLNEELIGNCELEPEEASAIIGAAIKDFVEKVTK